MKVLVTGGGGFLGSHIVRILRERGDQVRILGRHRYPEMEALGAECVQGDIANPEVVLAATEGVEGVFHTAAKAGVWGKYEDYFRPNVLGTKHVLEACRAHGALRLVHTSTPSVVYGEDPIEGGDESLPYPSSYLTHYPATKAEAEKMVLEAHEPGRLHTVALRPHLIWGPGDPHLIPRLVERARKGQIARVGDGNNKVSVVYVENAAHAHVMAFDAIATPESSAGGKAYFVNEPEPVVLWEFLERILDGVGAPRPKRKLSYGMAKRIGGAMELAYRALGREDEPKMTRFVAAQLATAHWFKVDAARRDFGFEPRVSIDEGLDRLFASLQASQTPAPRS